jgi:hypothetical protein
MRAFLVAVESIVAVVVTLGRLRRLVGPEPGGSAPARCAAAALVVPVSWLRLQYTARVGGTLEELAELLHVLRRLQVIEHCLMVEM